MSWKLVSLPGPAYSDSSYKTGAVQGHSPPDLCPPKVSSWERSEPEDWLGSLLATSFGTLSIKSNVFKMFFFLSSPTVRNTFYVVTQYSHVYNGSGSFPNISLHMQHSLACSSLYFVVHAGHELPHWFYSPFIGCSLRLQKHWSKEFWFF